MNRKQFLESLFGYGVVFGGMSVFKKKGMLSFLFEPKAESTPISIEADGKWHHYEVTKDNNSLWGDCGKYYLDGVEVPEQECLLQIGKPGQKMYQEPSPFDIDINGLFIYEDGAQCWARITEVQDV